MNAKKAGSYTVKVTAYDVNGNKAESSYKVTVKKKPQEQTQTQNTFTDSMLEAALNLSPAVISTFSFFSLITGFCDWEFRQSI